MDSDSRSSLQHQLASNPASSPFSTIASSHNSTKPIALYLPGLDGVGISCVPQFSDLSNTFELWRMAVDPRLDRSSFTELVEATAKFIWDLVEGGKELVLIGESFGGLLAPAVALRVTAMYERRKKNGRMEGPNPIKGMVLVNPATSFDETSWDTLGPLLTSLRHFENEDENESATLPTPYSVVGGTALSLLVPSNKQLQRIVSTIFTVDIDAMEGLPSMLDSFGILADNLPAEVVEHRVTRWLPVGTAVVNPRLEDLDVPTLVIAADDDNMLPTKDEAIRLAKVMPNCTRMPVKDAGHFVLDDGFNLTEAILKNAPFRAINDSPPRIIDDSYDPILDWQYPSQKEIDIQLDSTVKTIRTMTSPVFFSTDDAGKRYSGVGQIPGDENGPILFVGNHQFLGLDLGLVIAELVEKRGMIPRGLAHPIIFGGGGGGTGNFEQFGAVMVTPRNYYRLMATSQNALLFPGGVREVFHGRDEAYQLFWPDDSDQSKSDFVRTAAKFNATIIPLSGVGGADSVYQLVQSKDMVNLPFGLGERAANLTANTLPARFNQEANDEYFVPPLPVPKLLAARHYFVFGKPVHTSELNPKDREGCRRVYNEVKSELERGLNDVLKVRGQDPFEDTAERVVYEALWGKKAPTFPVEELNR